jgi:hypothetical protein
MLTAGLLLWISGEIMFATVAQGHMSNAVEPLQFVVRTEKEWQQSWRRHVGDSSPPAVEFPDRMVAAVFLGTRPTAGYSVEIVRVREEPDGLLVEYIEKRPSPDSFVAQVLTSPFHAVSFESREGPLRFRRVDGP